MTISYQLIPIRNNDVALNCDVTQEGQYLGRLYVFPTTNPNLLAIEIEKEWFLAHAEGEFVVSGHINKEEQWSLSPYHSLQPSKKYTTQSAIFDQVFSSEYVRDILTSRNLEPSLKSKDIAIINNSSSNGNEDFGEGQPSLVDNQLIIDWTALIPNLDVLRELLVSEVEQEQKVFSDEEFDEVQPDEIEEEATLPISPPAKQPIRMLDEELEEAKRFKIQNVLIDAVVEEYQELGTTEFVLPPFSIVTVRAQEEYFVLRSESDGHTILTATLDGEVMDELSLSDAAKFEEVLQFSEIEVSNRVTATGELPGNHFDTDNALMPPKNQELSGVEYGD